MHYIIGVYIEKFSAFAICERLIFYAICGKMTKLVKIYEKRLKISRGGYNMTNFRNKIKMWRDFL